MAETSGSGHSGKRYLIVDYFHEKQFQFHTNHAYLFGYVNNWPSIPAARWLDVMYEQNGN